MFALLFSIIQIFKINPNHCFLIKVDLYLNFGSLRQALLTAVCGVLEIIFSRNKDILKAIRLFKVNLVTGSWEETHCMTSSVNGVPIAKCFPLIGGVG